MNARSAINLSSERALCSTERRYREEVLAVAVNWCDVQNLMRSSTLRWLVRGYRVYLFETPEHKRFTVGRRQGLIEDVDRLGGCAMDYNHSRKAGNQGDVWKHAVLTAVADAIDVGEEVLYVESHSGTPVHQLVGGGEWLRGAGRVAGAPTGDSAYGAALAPWIRRSQYPASWVFVANQLAARAKTVNVELADTSDDVAQAYQDGTPLPVSGNVRVAFNQSDGFELAINALAPSLVFLDPPFSPDRELDWRRLAGTCMHLTEHGVAFLAWYPYSWPTLPNWLVETTQCETWEVLWAKCGPKPSQNLKGCGMLASHGIASLLHRLESELKPLPVGLGWEFRVRQPAA